MVAADSAGAPGATAPRGGTVGLFTIGAPPPSMARRQTENSGGALLTATPATLPAAGGRVRLRARVRQATVCRFSSSAREFRRLPSTRACASGHASVTIRVPRNASTVARSYVVYLTVSGAGGTERQLRDVILQRPRGALRPGGVTSAGETAASGVQTHSSAGGSSSPAAGGAGGRDAQSGGSGASASAALAPAVTAEPSNVSVQAGSPVSFSAAASGDPTPTVQWQVSANAGASWAPASPSFAASAPESGNEYRAVFTNSAGSATSDPATLTVQPSATTNFSGYISYAPAGQSFTAVTASWTVPTVTCQPGATTWAAQWPGIGDVTTVQQDGTETDCFSGQPSYWAWYEMYGDPNVNGGYAYPLPQASYPVRPGDQITASVSITGSTWLLALADITQNWNFQAQFPSPTPALSQGSAEWMVEDPDGCSPQCQVLSQFTPVQFSHADATLGTQTADISGFPLTQMEIDQNSARLAFAGPLDQSGDGFTDSWLSG